MFFEDPEIEAKINHRISKKRGHELTTHIAFSVAKIASAIHSTNSTLKGRIILLSVA